MKRIQLIGTLGVAASLTAAVPVRPLAHRASDDKQVTIVGCAVKGSGDGDGFLLANSVEQTTRTTSTPTTVTSSTTTTLGPSRVLFWLDDDDDVVEPHLGKQVEVIGQIEGDIERGNIEVERENGMIELEIKADGRKATVRLPDVPSAVGAPGSVGDREVKLPYRVQKLDVKSARMVAASCS